MQQIVLENVVKNYSIGGQSISAVNHVSLEINKGEFISVVGHSGSGKTTLLSMIGGIVQPTSGRIMFGGTDIHSLDSDGLSEYRSGKIGFMFQFASLLPILTAKENLLLPGLFSSDNRPVDAKRAEEYLELVGLKDKIEAYPSQLSGGQQRRVAIARAFMNSPEIILADEPTGDLDEETEAEIMALFRKLNEENKITFMFITHNLELAKHAQRQLRMNQGSIQEI
jgi:putative ABC transport system ATP-binding protein/lipoprotein-releasing system ATP-binding protein